MDEKQIANIKDQISADLMEMDVCDMTNVDGRNHFDELAKRVHSNVYRIKVFAAQKLQVAYDKCVNAYFASIDYHAKTYNSLLAQKVNGFEEDDITRSQKFALYETIKNNEFKGKVCKAFNEIIVAEEILTSQQQKELRSAQEELRGIQTQSEPIVEPEDELPPKPTYGPKRRK